MKTMSPSDFSRSVNTPKGTFIFILCPTSSSPSRSPENLPPGYTLMMNSARSSLVVVFAIEYARCSSGSVSGMKSSAYWPGQEVHLRRIDQLEHQALYVVRQRLDLLDLRVDQLQGDARVQHLLAEAEELDLQIAVGVSLAQQDEPFLLLELVEREGGEAVHLQVAVEEEGLARRALPLLAPVHQHHTVPERRVEHRLVLVYLDLDVNRLETNLVLFAHDCALSPLGVHTT